MRTVIATWEVEMKSIPNGRTFDHYVVGIGTTEMNEPNTARSHTREMPAGSYSGWLSMVDSTGKELTDPLRGNVDVPEDPTDLPPSDPDVAPVPITFKLSVQP